MNFRIYVAVVITTFVSLIAVHQISVHSVRLACWSGGYAEDAWMAYCNSDKYGVYDVDAVWFQTESDVTPAIKGAQVLTLSDSRLQNALSLGGATDWFAGHGYRTYMLGLPTEESGFGAKLLDKFKPQAAVIIFDASPYFTGRVGYSENALVEQPERERQEVEALKNFQSFHQRFCTRFNWFCGHTFSYFRSRLDGHWIFPSPSDAVWFGRGGLPNDDRRFPTNLNSDEAVPIYPNFLKEAQRLMAKIDLPHQCIVLTHVPNDQRDSGIARYLAESLGATLIDPEVANLYTFDRAHLTPLSSQRWTAEFLQQLEPTLQKCVALHDHASQT